MKAQRVYAGGAVVLVGIAILIASFVSSLVFLIYSIPIIVVGLFIVFNKNEDKIEEINYKEVKK